MPYVAIVTVLALLEYQFFGIMVGRARGRYGIAAPATTGHEVFERHFRVHMNTLEQLACSCLHFGSSGTTSARSGLPGWARSGSSDVLSTACCT